MPPLNEIVSEQFLIWEEQARGWKVWPHPTVPEPPFQAFERYRVPPAGPVVDDGRKPTFLSSLAESLERMVARPTPPVLPPAELPEPEATRCERTQLRELKVLLPPSFDPSLSDFGAFVECLPRCREPVAFEWIGSGEVIACQFALHPDDLPPFQHQLEARFPGAAFVAVPESLSTLWGAGQVGAHAIAELGLEQEWFYPLPTDGFDVFVGLVGAMAGLRAGELAVLQVLFQPVDQPWAEGLRDAVQLPDGSPLFTDPPDLLAQVERKTRQPLFAVVLRLASRAAESERAWEILSDLAAALGTFRGGPMNRLIPLLNDGYPHREHLADVGRRQTRRSGMILNLDELLQFVHLPSAGVSSPAFIRQWRPTKRAPASCLRALGTVLGVNSHAGQSMPAYLEPDHRVRHMHVVGASGTGKSTFLFNLIRQDIENGDGVAVLDPHGDLVDRILGVIPEHRIEDVVLVDPSDTDYSVGFNILTAHSEIEKALLASDLVSVFERLSNSWGDQMGTVFNSAIRAFLESRTGGTLADLRRFLLEPDFRAGLLRTVDDPEVLYYWRHAFPQLAGNRSVGPIVTRLQAFLARKPIAYMVSQKENRLDVGAILDEGKILLIKLPEGLIGRENTHLLGSLFVTKIQQAAMGRQRLAESERRYFWCYIDEFHNFITPSMAEILTGVRKYRLGMILAHQDLGQLQRGAEVEQAVMNAGIRTVFRVSDADAKVLAGGFSAFGAKDLSTLGTGEAICRVERSDHDFNLTVRQSPAVSESAAALRRQQVVEASRARYATPSRDVEAALRAAWAAPGQPAAAPAPVAVPKPVTIVLAPEPIPPAPEPSGVPSLPPAKHPVQEPVAEPDLRLHERAKEEIRGAAEALDYTVATEVEILGGKGRVDVVLERGIVRIACQVCATTSGEHEATNAAKCIEAGFTRVAILGFSRKKLGNLQALLVQQLPGDQLARVACYLKAEFFKALEDWAAQDPEGGAAERAKRRKRAIELSGGTLSDDERSRREKEMLRKIQDRMKRGSGGSGPAPT